MMYDKISGRFGDNFYQLTKGGKQQFKSRLIAWTSNHNPNNGVVQYRILFRNALIGKKFQSRTEMYTHIKAYIAQNK